MWWDLQIKSGWNDCINIFMIVYTIMSKTKKNKTGHKKTRKQTYSTNDFNSDNGMLTSVWGPGLWHFLHTMSFNYPTHPTNENKKKYSDFILSLVHILPCKHCRVNLKSNLKKHPLTDKYMTSRDTFSKYVYDLHECVNKLLGKQSALTYDDVKLRYEDFRSRCSVQRKKQKAESGCTEPLYGEKAKCVLKIVPFTEKINSFQIDNRCVKKRMK